MLCCRESLNCGTWRDTLLYMTYYVWWVVLVQCMVGGVGTVYGRVVLVQCMVGGVGTVYGRVVSVQCMVGWCRYSVW